MKIKAVLLLIMVIAAGSYVSAQSLTPFVIASSGGYNSNAAGSLSSTVGELTMVETFSATGNFLTQGFQQPEEWYASVEEEPVNGDLSLYPNPSYGQFNLYINAVEKGSAQMTLYEMMGQKTLSKQADIDKGANTINFDIHGFAMGIYFLEYKYVSDIGKKQSKTFKINLVY